MLKLYLSALNCIRQPHIEGQLSDTHFEINACIHFMTVEANVTSTKPYTIDIIQ